MKTAQRSKMKWLWENMKGYRALYFICIFGTIVYNVMHLAVPYVTQILVDTFLSGDDAAYNLQTRQPYLIQLLVAMVVLTHHYWNIINCPSCCKFNTLRTPRNT